MLTDSKSASGVAIIAPTPIDWPLGGAQELAGLAAGGGDPRAHIHVQYADEGVYMYTLDNYRDITTVDIDIDGSSELLLFDTSGSVVPKLIAASTPGSRFDCAVTLTGLPVAHAAATGDFDGDGDEDIALLDALGSVRLFAGF